MQEKAQPSGRTINKQTFIKKDNILSNLNETYFFQYISLQAN